MPVRKKVHMSVSVAKKCEVPWQEIRNAPVAEIKKK